MYHLSAAFKGNAENVIFAQLGKPPLTIVEQIA